MAFFSDTHTTNPSFTHRIGAVFHTAADAMRKRSAYRRTVRELSALTDRELSDLGVSRSTIRSIAMETTYDA